MKLDSHVHLLNLHRLPARLTAEQTAQLLGCTTDDIRLLVRAGLLHALGGSVPPNSVKFYATVDVEERMIDRGFLDKMTRVILRQHQAKNRTGSTPTATGSRRPNGAARPVGCD